MIEVIDQDNKQDEDEILISCTNLLLSINNQENYKVIQDNIQNDLIFNFLIYFSNNDLNSDTLKEYLENNDNNMDNIKNNLVQVINDNKSILLLDLEEQYFSVKKNIYYYHCFHDALFLKKITRNPYLEFEFNKIEQDFKNLRSLFEPQVKNIYEDNISSNISHSYNLSNLKKFIDSLETDTINYKRKLCSYLDIHPSHWKKEFNSYCSHLNEITIEDVEQINKSIKRSLVNFENEPILDRISALLQDNLFIKVKKSNSLYLMSYGSTYLGKKYEGEFCKKILVDVFNNGFINQWKHYRFDFSKSISEFLYNSIKDSIPSINKIDFNIALDNYVEQSNDFKEILCKSIKECYRKKAKNENLVNFDFRTSFISLNYKFSKDIVSLFRQNFSHKIDDLTAFLLMNYKVEDNSSNELKDDLKSPFEILKKPRL